jgi:TetR/AcrR family transcriptional regulator
MPTKNDPPAESLRDKILAAAWVEFGDKGFAGARMDEIAKISGASKQVLYHHFSNKDGLFQAVVEKAYLDVRSADERLRRSLLKIDPEDALRKLIDTLFRTGIETIRFQRIMHDENKFEAAHTREMHHVRDIYRKLIELIADILERGAQLGKFRTGIDPEELFVSLAGLFMFRLTNRYTLSVMLDLPLNTEKGARNSRQEAVKMVLDSLRARSPS